MVDAKKGRPLRYRGLRPRSPQVGQPPRRVALARTIVLAAVGAYIAVAVGIAVATAKEHTDVFWAAVALLVFVAVRAAVRARRQWRSRSTANPPGRTSQPPPF